MTAKRKIRLYRGIDLEKVVRAPTSSIYAEQFAALKKPGDNFRASGVDVAVASLRTLASRHKKKTGVKVSVQRTDNGAVVFVP